MTASAMSLENKQAPWWLILMGGILNVIVGLLLLTSPVRTVFVLVLALGFYWIFTGILTLVGMFVDNTAWGWKLFMGLLSLAAGIIILRYPLVGAITVPAIMVLILGVQGFTAGLIGLLLAFKGGGWGAGILSFLSMAFGLILMFNFTSPALIVTFVWMTGIFALAGGIAQSVLAFKQRSAY